MYQGKINLIADGNDTDLSYVNIPDLMQSIIII